MSPRTLVAIAGAAAALHSLGAAAADLPPDVLVQSSRVKITRADVDAELQTIPSTRRYEFAASSERMSKLLNSLLETKTLAGEARASGLDKDPEVQARIAVQIDRLLAAARSEQIEREAEAEFNRRRDDFMGRAHELYLLDKARYTLPEQIRASHILVKTDKHANDEALKLALEIRAKAVENGADFRELARQYSEDPSAKKNAGSLGWFSANQMDRAFWAGALALRKPGDISEPVLSSFGYHIILLEEKRPAQIQSFEVVKNQALAEVRNDYVKAAKIKMLDGIYKDPSLEVNQPAIDSLPTKIDPEIYKKAGAPAPIPK